MKRLVVLYILTFLMIQLDAQVAFLAGSYQTATASGNGAAGLPSLSYTPAAGTDRLLIFTLTYERDHSGAKGTNWANPKSVGGADPVVTLGGTTLTRLHTVNYYQYTGAKNTSNATMSVEMVIYGILEASIPAGTNTFNITGINTPGHSGDEATVSAMMFENVIGVNYLGSDGCENCNSLSMTGLDPLDGNNMILSLVGVSSDRDISAGAGNTLAGRVKNANASGAFKKFSEQDGISKGAQYVGGTAAVQNPSFSFSGSADVFGAVTAGFRLLSNVVLPVELISFEATRDETDHVIEWETQAEINAATFEVEISDEGDTWTTLSSVSPAGDPYRGAVYVYVNQEVYSSKYYRLKMIDEDGSFEYSEARYVEANDGLFTKVYPNPTAGDLIVEGEDVNQIEIYSTSGQLIRTIDMETSFVKIRGLHGLPVGNYIIRLNGAQASSTHLVTKK